MTELARKRWWGRWRRAWLQLGNMVHYYHGNPPWQHMRPVNDNRDRR